MSWGGRSRSWCSPEVQPGLPWHFFYKSTGRDIWEECEVSCFLPGDPKNFPLRPWGMVKKRPSERERSDRLAQPSLCREGKSRPVRIQGQSWGQNLCADLALESESLGLPCATSPLP